jgi:hypothetical protein
MAQRHPVRSARGMSPPVLERIEWSLAGYRRKHPSGGSWWRDARSITRCHRRAKPGDVCGASAAPLR